MAKSNSTTPKQLRLSYDQLIDIFVLILQAKKEGPERIAIADGLCDMLTTIGVSPAKSQGKLKMKSAVIRFILADELKKGGLFKLVESLLDDLDRDFPVPSSAKHEIGRRDHVDA